VRRRILALIVAVAACSVLAFFVPATFAIRSAIRRRDLLELQREGSVVASDIALEGAIDLARLRDDLPSGHDLAVYDASGHRLEGVGPAVADAVVARGADGVVDEGYVDGDLVVEVPVRPGAVGPMSVVRVLEPHAESQHRFRRSIAMLAAAAVTVVAAAALAGLLFAWWMGRPVENLRRWATGFGHDLHPAPPPTGIGELDDLGATIADAHGRIHQLLQRERSFSSHVSHQLRTPVAAMRVAVEAELAAPRPDGTLVLHESLQALDRLEATIESMLALTRQPDRAPSWVDVRSLLDEQVARWAPSYRTAHRRLTAPGVGGSAQLDEACVHHILDVLLDNALVHGAGTASLTARIAVDRIEFDVGDDGAVRPGSDPFSEQRSGGGHGIGLRLARTLAESAGGQLIQVEAASTRFRLTLPLPA
jgi:signal transduction histidine kinase